MNLFRLKQRKSALFAAALGAALALLASAGVRGYGQADNEDIGADANERQYTFSWQHAVSGDMAPRGGTTQGAEVILVTEPSPEWLRLQEPGISKKERDRRAILSMAGPYRTSFDFIETIGFTHGYAPSNPYQSWGTEYVYVVTDKPDMIQLQHILVMEVKKEDGSAMDPIVVKHWRQDWMFEAPTMHTFKGNREWKKQAVRAERRGHWVQAVYQVDDSPRYTAAGEWQHTANFSSWKSDETWRPLPRREFSVRQDYDVLIGTNHHTITPTGWVQEEQNLKVVLNGRGGAAEVLARENGLARYERIAEFNWLPGDDYWERTKPFWAKVRAYWSETFTREDHIVIAKQADGAYMFTTLFQMAEEPGIDWSASSEQANLEAVMARYVTFPP
ncbi:hypothetical protein BST95_01530 [Halioglobus japonicus]|uniref:DUF1329 domain-containing protein n=1 Tax=Halioglobus japonicus TaxID=930805 RepID=A0AAP8MBZ5_9GAMM|nr:DUF6607 family protein [Halioglobus japonicus]AQA17091.1 hypothetical protein BST95_01530 [Halioglobus japonicus]PLW85001.1 hypothetical protein C0029_15790 [Halioglobus japonicus]GHD18944.1 hypothetical protein GCM10007052_26840 [Halioglobus japonicus]